MGVTVLWNYFIKFWAFFYDDFTKYNSQLYWSTAFTHHQPCQLDNDDDRHVLYCAAFCRKIPSPHWGFKAQSPFGREAGTVEHIDATSPEYNAISNSIHCCVIIVFVIKDFHSDNVIRIYSICCTLQNILFFLEFSSSRVQKTKPPWPQLTHSMSHTI